VKFAAEFRDPQLVLRLATEVRNRAARLSARLGRRARIMEVCGTHTVSIHRHGLKHLVGPDIKLVSGPGCPICVTETKFIDQSVKMALDLGVVVATFGDMVNVPGSELSLADARARGASINVVVSPLEALRLAGQNPGRKVVFLAVGFETTAPAVAATILEAKREELGNLLILCGHKLVPPALLKLLGQPDVRIDGLILPGHVSTIIGTRGYQPLVDELGVCCAVAGFEPVDVLLAILMLLSQIEDHKPSVGNEYLRAVRPEGNPTALGLIDTVFEPVPAHWRGLGLVEASGLALREEFSRFDAACVLDLSVSEPRDDPNCRCADVLLGRADPPDCPLFAKVCTPQAPHGPCMVSSEGSCSAWFKYQEAAVADR